MRLSSYCLWQSATLAVGLDRCNNEAVKEPCSKLSSVDFVLNSSKQF